MDEQDTTHKEKDHHARKRMHDRIQAERASQRLHGQGRYQYRLGTLQKVIQTAQDLELLDPFLNIPLNKQITSNVARAVITEEVLRSPSPQLHGLLRLDLVLMIPLKDSGNADLRDCYQVAFARNAPERRPPPEHYQKELAEAEATFLAARSQPLNGEKLANIRSSYSCIRLTHESDNSLIQSYRDLLDANFGEADELDDHLSDDDAAFFVAVPKLGPPDVAAGIYVLKDTTILSRKSKEILLVTYRSDGGAVRSEFQGHGLYTILQCESLSYLAGKQDPLIHVVFGFANITTPAPLKTTAKLGFTLATETAALFNFSLTPMRWMVKGTSVDEIGASMPGNTLRKIYGKGNEQEIW